MRGYGLIAPFYDHLVKLVFGDKLKELQCSFLKKIQSNDKVLILGGGTGWILEEIDSVCVNTDIVYIDKSPSMIKRAKRRILHHNEVCLLYTSPSPRDKRQSRMPSSA